MMKLFYSNELRTLEKYAFIQNYTPAYTEVISLVTTRTFVLSIITRRRIKFEGLTTLWSFLCRAILECVHSIHPFDVSSCTHACKRVIKVRYISRRVLSRLPFRFTLVDTSVRAKRKKKKERKTEQRLRGYPGAQRFTHERLRNLNRKLSVAHTEGKEKDRGEKRSRTVQNSRDTCAIGSSDRSEHLFASPRFSPVGDSQKAVAEICSLNYERTARKR